MPSEPLLASIAVIAGVVGMLVDGRNAVVVAALATGLGLAPTVAVGGGLVSVLVLLGAAVLAGLVAAAARSAAHALPVGSGMDPTIPVYAPREQLFGPRSVRTAAAAAVLPAASWVTYNVPVAGLVSLGGLLFPIAYFWMCGVMRLITSRTLEDLAVAVILIGGVASASWMTASQPGTLGPAIGAAACLPGAALVASWLSGRYTRRPA